MEATVDGETRPRSEDYAVLTQARAVLTRIGQEHYAKAYGVRSDAGRHGMASQACDTAEQAIFQVLNVLGNHCDDGDALVAAQR